MNEHPDGLEGLGHLPDILDELNADRRRALMRMGLIAGLGVVFDLALVLFLSGNAAILFVIIAFAPGWVLVAVLVAGLNFRARRARKVMPLLAAAAGMHHSWGTTPAARLEEALVLPPGGDTKVQDDGLSGKLGDISFTSHDLRLMTTGKNSRSLFNGIVLGIEPVTGGAMYLRVHVPEFGGGRAGQWAHDRMAPTPRGWLQSGTVELRRGTQAILHPALEPPHFDVAAAAQAVEAVLPDKAQIFRIRQGKERADIAITLTGGLFDLGGLFTSEEKVREKMDDALAAMALPAKVADAWTAGQPA
ncbi:hypothetical protein [Pseudoroseicyclus sp. CXY001]|uniref:hypothetical protein n=1 Tax=Pseudoroseicyclus sp. CXY001 TaxID=3242492 RepID=UPI0035712A54